MKYFVSFRTTLKVSRYLFRALALLLWLLIMLFSVFYIVSALHDKESEIRQEFNLSFDQAQRYIQRTSDVMKELKYIAENRLNTPDGALLSAGKRDASAEIPAFMPLWSDSDCNAMSNAWRGSLQSMSWFLRYWRDNFSAAYDLNRVFLIGTEDMCLANFGLRDRPVERDSILKSFHDRIVKYRNQPQEERTNGLYWIGQGHAPAWGIFMPSRRSILPTAYRRC